MSKRKKDSDVSFLGRILIFFRPTYRKIREKRIIRSAMERQKELACYTGSESTEEAKISYGFSIAKAASVILLISILIFTLFFGSHAVSYEKVYYMFKDISYIKSFGESTPSILSYTGPMQNQVFCSYKGGLAVASDSEIKTFTSTGRVTMSIGSEFTNPKMSASKQYLLVYDQGGNSYSIYNSFVRLYGEKLDFPISYAEMAKNGSFLIVTGAERYGSVVCIYDRDFSLMTEYKKNDRVISASLSHDGRYVAVLSVDVDQGESSVSLNVIDCKKNKIISTTSYKGSMPYKCQFLANDRIAVLLDAKACVVDRKGRVQGEYTYGSSLERIAFCGDKFAFVLSNNDNSNQKNLVVINKEGKTVLNETIYGGVRDLKLGDDAVYVLQNGKLLRIGLSIGAKKSMEVDTVGAKLVVFDDGKVALCTETSAKYVSFD